MPDVGVWPNFTFCLGLTVFLLGVVMLLLVWLSKSAHDLMVSLEYPAKILSEVVQVISALATIGCTVAVTASKVEWVPTLIAASLSTGVWKIIQVVIDRASKRSVLWYQSRIESEEAKSAALSALLTLLRYAVAEKLKRLDSHHRAQTSTSQVAKILETALLPVAHLRDLLQLITTFMMRVTGRIDCKIRAGLYLDTDGYAYPVSAYDNNEHVVDVFASYEKHKEKFNLTNNADPSEVVKCFRSRQTIIHCDCSQAGGNGFTYFEDHQRSYLASMICMHIGRCVDMNGRPSYGVLAIDSSSPGVFDPKNQELLELCLHDFSNRIKLELLLHAIIKKRGMKDARSAEVEPTVGARTGEGENVLSSSSASVAEQNQERPESA